MSDQNNAPKVYAANELTIEIDLSRGTPMYFLVATDGFGSEQVKKRREVSAQDVLAIAALQQVAALKK